MKIVVGDRGTGRSTRLVKWLLEGRQTQKYFSVSGWSRVILVTSQDEVRFVRNLIAREIVSSGHPELAGILNYAVQVISQDFFRGKDPDLESAIDDVDRAITVLTGGWLPSVMSVTGTDVEWLATSDGTGT